MVTAHLLRRLQFAVDTFAEPKFGGVPRHVGVVPLDPRQAGAVARQSWRAVEIGTRCEHGDGPRPITGHGLHFFRQTYCFLSYYGSERAFKFLMGGGIGDAVDTAAGVGDNATAAVSDVANAAKDTATNAAATATDAASSAVSNATDAATGAVANATDAAGDAMSSASGALAGAMDLDPSAIGDQVSGLFSGAADTLSGITDADSATAALPAIGELGTKVDSVTELFQKVPESARGPISDITQKGMGALEPIFNKTMQIPGVGDVIGGSLGPIMEKLQELGS